MEIIRRYAGRLIRSSMRPVIKDRDLVETLCLCENLSRRDELVNGESSLRYAESRSESDACRNISTPSCPVFRDAIQRLLHRRPCGQHPSWSRRSVSQCVCSSISARFQFRNWCGFLGRPTSTSLSSSLGYQVELGTNHSIFSPA